MNILNITHSYYPENNAGVELYVHELSAELSKKHNVLIFTRSKSVKSTVTEYNEHYAIVKNPKKQAKGKILKSFLQCMQLFKPDIIHIHHLMGMGLCIPQFLQKRNIPYVITLHDYWYACPRVRLMKKNGSMCNFPSDDCAACVYPSKILKRTIFRYKNRMRRAKGLEVLNNAAYIITPSKLVKRRFLDYGVRNENFDVSQLGINMKEFRSRKHDIRDRSDIRIGFIGTISTFKGVDVLLKAFALLNSENKLYLYGKMLKGDEQLITEMIKNDNRVVHKGIFDHKDIMSILENTDILVVPSVSEESHALVIDEGRAAGIPVIASAIGAVPERIEEGVNSFLVEPGNVGALKEKMQWLIDNYNDVVGRMNFHYKLLSIQEDAAHNEDVYREVINKKLS